VSAALKLVQKFQVPVTADLSSPEDVLDDEDWQPIVARRNNWPEDSTLAENHVVTALANKLESFYFENTDQFAIGDGNDSRHPLTR